MSAHALPLPPESFRELERAPALLRDRVPYITSWSGEGEHLTGLIWVGDRIGRRREKRWDRGPRGELWRTMIGQPGWGRPEFAQVHITRQRRAMGGLWCQVCGRAGGTTTAEGTLFLNSLAEHERMDASGEWLMSQPPVCVPCARVAVKVCPHLRSYVAVRGVPRPWGVKGVLYERDLAYWKYPREAVTGKRVRYDDPQLFRVEATQLIVELREVQVVDLEAEA